jgi:hypothetical protein
MRLALLLALCICLNARATTASTDFTDLWVTANESGWGANVMQQNDILFISIFVYSQDGSPTWYVGSDVVRQSSSQFTGTLYQTTGPWFGSLFDPTQVFLRPVGSITFNAITVATGTLTYSVDGVQVAKSIRRLSLKGDNLSGNFIGASVGVFSSCSNPINNGPAELAAVFSVSQSGNSVQILETGNGYTCTHTGTYSQYGRTAQVNGNSSCSTGEFGTFTAFELVASIGALTGRLISDSNVCHYDAHFGGIRRR